MTLPAFKFSQYCRGAAVIPVSKLQLQEFWKLELPKPRSQAGAWERANPELGSDKTCI